METEQNTYTDKELQLLSVLVYSSCDHNSARCPKMKMKMYKGQDSIDCG